ncbi:MAG: AMP-binding protein, partial [Anaerolineales bacterium]|nr:AMP-binding protein [Anaerolineales bacterium]
MSQSVEPQDASARLLRVTTLLVQETHPGRRGAVTLDSSLERDLGLDSLARVELLLRIGKEFGVTLPEAALGEADTLRDLLGFQGHAASATATPAAAELPQGAFISAPEAATTLVEVLEWHASLAPDRTHVLLCGEGEQTTAITYAELLAAARRIASGLVSRGLQPQQAVALMLPTGKDYLASFFGVLLAGGVPVPIYPPARLAQIEDHLKRHARILDNAQAVRIVTVPQAKAVAALLRARVPSLAEIVTPGEIDAEPAPLRYRAKAEDIAFLQYTSGSTGDPKGVVLTHANLLANLRAMGPAFQVSSEDVFVSWLPLYHDMGLIGAWLGSLYFAMPLVLMSPLAF